MPQRFSKSETFLIRLGAEQQARIMSELPNNLEGLHQHVKRYSEKNDEILFEELSLFIDEEKIRRQLTMERPGELFFFYKADYIVVTEEFSKIPLNSDEFTGIPSLLDNSIKIKLKLSDSYQRSLSFLVNMQMLELVQLRSCLSN